jgi:hypothetical protein
MRTAEDHLREIAQDMGLNTEWNERAWPDFLLIFRNYVTYRDQMEYRHKEACDSLLIGTNSPWRDIFYELYRVILDEPELWY